MSRIVSYWQLTDGPLIDRRQRRESVVQRMAKDLIAQDAWRDRDVAVDTLLTLHYPTLDVFAPGTVDDARQIAMQEAVVAVEMSRVQP